MGTAAGLFIAFFGVSADRQLVENKAREVLDGLQIEATISDYIPEE